MTWKCKVCGYIHEGDMPDGFKCPKCGAPREAFEKVKDETKKSPYAGTRTEKNLWEAFAGESQARNKYTYFASVAKKQGFEQIAALFLKTADNEQKRNGQTLSFNASAVVKPVGNAAEYRIESNTVTGSQQCVYTHTTQLPYTGDDTNMPVLIGLFSLFVICGGASSFVILRKRKTDSGEIGSKE